MDKPRNPALTVDVFIRMDDGRFALIRRKNPPFQGQWALPGGFVDYGEPVERAAVREMKEETSLDVELVHLLGVYSDPSRDPRGHTVSVVYIGKPVGGELKAADDAAEVGLFDGIEGVELAFDHRLIVTDAMNWLARGGPDGD